MHWPDLTTHHLTTQKAFEDYIRDLDVIGNSTSFFDESELRLRGGGTFTEGAPHISYLLYASKISRITTTTLSRVCAAA